MMSVDTPAPARVDDRQAEVIAFMMNPDTHGGDAPIHIETHLSHLFVVGDLAYKLKKARRWAMVDYATLKQREHFCRREIEVNAAAAGPLYAGLCQVTQEGGDLRLGGLGPTVEWMVRMHRFPDRAQLDMMVDDGAMTGAHADDTADAIAAMHRRAPILRRRGEVERVGALAAQLVRDVCVQDATGEDERDAAQRWLGMAQAKVATRAADIDRRARHGFVRRCHGDLHLSNICIFHGRPMPFDAIEFSDDIATTDCLYDLAFVLVDLEERGRTDLSVRILSRYMEWSRDYRGLAMLPLFMSLRAMVRALTRAAKGQPPRPHIDDALAILRHERPRALTAIGGLSGSGKSTLARVVSGTSGSIVIRSDAVRKHLFGVAPHDRLPTAGYSAAVSSRVYRRVLASARTALWAGWPVILDATFLDEEARGQARALAEAEGVPFNGIWLDVPVDVMMDRVDARRGDVSDADRDVVRKQAARTLGTIDWRRLDGRRAAECNAEMIGRGTVAPR